MADVSRGEQRKCPQCDTPLDISDILCPACGHTFDEKDRTLINELLFYIEEEEGIEKEQTACPGCGEVYDERPFMCRICGEKLKPEIKEVPEEVVEKVNSLIDDALSLIAWGDEGVECVGGVEKWIGIAKLALAENSADEALSAAEHAREAAALGNNRYQSLIHLLKRNENRIKYVHEHGGDVEEARVLYEKAQEAIENRDYGSAYTFAVKCKDAIDKARSKSSAWKVEIGDYL